MPNIPILIAPFEGVYIGDYGSSSVLTRLNALRSDGARIQESLPTEFTHTTDGAEIVGNHTVNLTLTVLAGDELAVRLLRGLSVSSGTINSTPGTQQYSLFLVHPYYTGKQSIWLPQIRTNLQLDQNYNKNAVSKIELQFTAEKRDHSTSIIVRDTVANCLTAIGGTRAPFVYS